MMDTIERQITFFTTFFILFFSLCSADFSVEWDKYFENELPINAINRKDSSCILLTSNTLRVFSQNGLLRWSKNIIADSIYALDDTLFLVKDSSLVGINYHNGDSIFSRVNLKRYNPGYFATLDSFSCKIGRLDQFGDTMWSKTSDTSGYTGKIDTLYKYENMYFIPSPNIVLVSIENGCFAVLKEMYFQGSQSKRSSFDFKKSFIEVYDSNGVYKNRLLITDMLGGEKYDFYSSVSCDSKNTFTISICHYDYYAGPTYTKSCYYGELNTWGNPPSRPINSIEINPSSLADIFIINSEVIAETDRIFITGKYNVYREMSPWEFLLLETTSYGKILQSYSFGYDSTYVSPEKNPDFSESPFILKSTESSIICWGKLKNGTKLIKLNTASTNNVKSASRIANKNLQVGIVAYDVLGRKLYSNRINTASSNILCKKASNTMLIVNNNTVSSFTYIK